MTAFRIEPLAQRRADARPVAARPGAAAWQMLARIDHPDPALANEIALRELKNGASGLVAGVCRRGRRLRLWTAGQRARARARARGLRLRCRRRARTRSLAARGGRASTRCWRRALRLRIAGAGIRIGHDPIGAMAIARERGAAVERGGAAFCPAHSRRWRATGFAASSPSPTAASSTMPAARRRRNWPSCSASRSPICARSKPEGVALDAARRMIFFRLAADADQFLTIAKFRALRKLWARVEAACGLAPEPAFVSAETAWRMMTQRDPHVNILRATIAAFAAALGGADAITVLPFTAALGLPERFARRIARNTQLVLLEESHLAKVADPAAGSGARRGSDRPALPDGLGAVPRDRSGRRYRRCARRAAWSSKKSPTCVPSARPRSRAGRMRSPASACSPIFTKPKRRSMRRLPARPAVTRGGLDCRSGWPSRSKLCATPPTGCWRRPARGRRSFSPRSARRRISRARATFAKNFFEAGGIEAGRRRRRSSAAALAAAFKAVRRSACLPVLVRQGL